MKGDKRGETGKQAPGKPAMLTHMKGDNGGDTGKQASGKRRCIPVRKAGNAYPHEGRQGETSVWKPGNANQAMLERIWNPLTPHFTAWGTS